MGTFVRLLGAVAVAVSLAACGGLASPSSAKPDDFSGTLAPLGQASKPFSVSRTGEMQVTLQSLTPRPVVGFVTVAIGLPSGDLCVPLAGYFVSQAAIGQQYAFPQISKGSFCVVIADVNGILTSAVSFSIQVLHP